MAIAFPPPRLAAAAAHGVGREALRPVHGPQLRFFDFLRGWASLLVFVAHAAVLGGGPVLLGHARLGAEAVNTFMFSSGFLIFYQCATSADYAGFGSSRGVFNFYVRRWFRIAPVYFLALAVALAAAPWLGEAYRSIAQVTGIESENHLQRFFIPDRVGNGLLHLSFLYGLFPQYAHSTPLPDWSLGLEMQFYLAFPVLFILLRQKHMAWALLALLAGALALRIALKAAGVVYPMPSLLPLKFHNFAAGMVVAYLYLNPGARRAVLLGLVLLFVGIGERGLWMPALVLATHWVLGRTRRAGGIDRLFVHWTSHWLAQLSYGVYILHMLVMLPVLAWLVPWTSRSMLAWCGVTALLLATTLALAWVVLHVVERPGIAFGKRLLRHRERQAALI